ncbi:hypothetical protein RDI58_004136 [Solanum bulbocastanum]|uniref:Uncharacterized protein n=1 Tax=Solanum bulbocastanum TaxID=147425 RepID=A0AAN8YL06_SOLBU
MNKLVVFFASLSIPPSCFSFFCSCDEDWNKTEALKYKLVALNIDFNCRRYGGICSYTLDTFEKFS